MRWQRKKQSLLVVLWISKCGVVVSNDSPWPPCSLIAGMCKYIFRKKKWIKIDHFLEGSCKHCSSAQCYCCSNPFSYSKVCFHKSTTHSFVINIHYIKIFTFPLLAYTYPWLYYLYFIHFFFPITFFFF